MSLRDFVHIGRERWRLVAALGLLGLVAGIVVTVLSVPQYTAHTDVYVAAQPTGDSTAAYQGALLAEQKARGYVQLVSGGNFARDVATATRLDPLQVPQQLVVSSQADSSLIVVSATDPSPARAAELSDAGAAALVRVVGGVERTAPGQTPPVTAQVVEPATVPTAPVTLGPPVYVVLGLLAGLIAGFALAVLRATLDSTVRTASSVSALLGAPSLGLVPRDEEAHVSVRIADNPLSPTAEAYRKVRTGLEFVGLARDARTIVVTSATEGEGKTGVVGNLAVVIAQQGHRVVVVDADLRRPRLAAFFGAPDDVGLTNVLLGQLPLGAAVQPGRAGGVAVLARGSEPPNPADLVASAPMSGLLDQLAASYDFVLIDTPPLAAVADASILASRSDGVVVVVRSGHTTGRQLGEARAALSAATARVLGAVLVVTDRGAASTYTGTGTARPWRRSGRGPAAVDALSPGADGSSGTGAARSGTSENAPRLTELRPVRPSPTARGPEDAVVNGEAVLSTGQDPRS